MDIKKKQKLDFILGGTLLFFLRLPVIVFGKLMKRDHAAAAQGTILVIKMLGGGSLVLAYPSLLGIRRRYKDRKLILLTLESTKQFGESLNLFDEIICISDRSALSLVSSALIAWGRCFRRLDTVVDLEVYSKMTTVFSVLTAARNRVGFYLENTYWRRRIHTHLLFFNRYSGSFHFYDAITRLLDAEVATRRDCEELLRQELPPVAPRSTRKRIALGHSCSDFGMERTLTPKQWASILRGRNVSEEELVFLGGKADRLQADKIIDFLKERFPGLSFVNMCGLLSLKESVSNIASADEFWGIDSALLHYARLLGRKTVSFWGPTDPQTRLRDDDTLVSEVFYRKIQCSPCIHVAETPPCRGLSMCMEAIFDENAHTQSLHHFIIV
jgi:ADP-heptose:LPS heptosyltransferase